MDARSRAGGHHFLSENVPLPPKNGAIVMSSASAAEAETGGLYINARKAVEERNIYWRRWATSSRPPLFRQTTPRPKASSTIVSSPIAQKPWICVSTGCETGRIKSNSDFIGGPAQQTGGITIPRTIQRPIIAT
eukprot:scaffold69367_cov90-Cyclotella_meneghiniana.AAC.2